MKDIAIWDKVPMEASHFAPSDLDCNQWAKTARDAGAKYIVLTAKHHDGFANWPSKYTDFSVAHSPWRDGKGDVIRDFVDACRRYDLKVGIYYSPADASSSAFETGNNKAYDDYFIGQIGELLSGYGDIDILWFDGCHSEGHDYNWVRIFGEIRRMQPNILIFNMGDPNFRWVGNEAGIAPIPCWNTVSEIDFSVLAEGKQELNSGEPRWLPAECDCRMRDINWFYSDHDERTVKSAEELMGLYDLSIGRGCNLLINIGPDRRGLLPELDSKRLIEFGEQVKRRFASPAATLESATLTENAAGWKFEGRGQRIDQVMIQEDLTHGEHIRRFRVEAEIFPHSQTVTLWEGQNVGHKAICRFPCVRAKSLNIRIVESDGRWALRSASLFDNTSVPHATADAQSSRYPREEIEWLDAWIVDGTQKANLPRVLLIGDSIARGYRDDVARLLEGVASVCRFSTSKSLGDPGLLEETELIARAYPWDIIHFNNGLHGQGYTEQQYRAALPEWLAHIKDAAPNAELIWASSTAVRERGELNVFTPFNARVVERNAIAAEVLGAQGIAVNDLYALTAANPQYYSEDGVHFNPEGKIGQAEQIAALLTERLAARRA